jgi:hypothetical protein
LDWNLLSACSGPYLLPVCINGVSINDHSSSCPKSICFPTESLCTPTPADTFDYLPPTISSKTCNPVPTNQPLAPYYGMEGGLPPEYSNLQKVNLVIRGTVSGGDSMTSCKPLNNVKIQFFQIDPDLFEENPLNDEADLRKMSCQGLVTSDINGNYEFQTLIPPSYGPPRHLNLIITVSGYQTLLTRIYFTQDLRLQQLSVGHNSLTAHEIGGHFNDGSYHFETIQNSRPFLRKILSQESRVCNLNFVVDDDDDVTGGRFIGQHDLILQPNLPDLSSIALSGYWTDPHGSMIRIETIGNFFFATQYPHLRTWGTVSGILRENTIFGANFRSGNLSLSLSHFHSTFSPLTPLYSILLTSS